MTTTWTTVRVMGHDFDALQPHDILTANGTGRTLRVATHRAITTLLADKRLKWKRMGSFKLSIVVIKEGAKP